MEFFPPPEAKPPPPPSPAGPAPLLYALVGQRNVGKSALFGVLTGRYATVSNFPGTTVELTRGSFSFGGRRYDLVDTPGVQSLIPLSEEERVTRDFVTRSAVDGVVQVADAKNLARSLVLTFELGELGVPTVLALNMWDEAEALGISIDLEVLSARLGVAVVPTAAVLGRGIRSLRRSLPEARPPRAPLSYGREVEARLDSVERALASADGRCPPRGRRGLALMILAGDPTAIPEGAPPPVREELVRLSREGASGGRPPGVAIPEARALAARALTAETSRPAPEGVRRPAEALGRWLTHPLWGALAALGVLAVLYLFVGKLGAQVLVDAVEHGLFEHRLLPWLNAGADRWIPGSGARAFLLGPYGLVSMGLTYALSIVFPVVTTFFVAFAALEDSGYLSRLAVMLHRAMRPLGLNGEAVVPMILGLGCDTMATLTARILPTQRERILVTFLLALGVPCSAQLGVTLGLLGGLRWTGAVVWAGAVLAVMAVVGGIAAKLLPGERPPLILEIPPLRVPRPRNVLVKSLGRVEWYLREAVPLFLLGTVLLFVLDRFGALGGLTRALEPLTTGWLGLPREAAPAFLMGFLRRDYGAAGFFALAQRGLLDPVQQVSALVTITLFIPCVANFFMMIRERGAAQAFAMAALIIPVAFLAGGVTLHALRWLGASF